jgi:hypothetical protein
LRRDVLPILLSMNDYMALFILVMALVSLFAVARDMEEE